MKNKSILIIMFISIIVFFSITFIFTGEKGTNYDQNIVNWVYDISTTTIVKIMNVISLIGASEVILFITLIIAALFVLKKDWYHTIFFLSLSVGGVVLNFLLKILFHRERPGNDVSNIEVFNFSLEIPSYSFPSGHTMRSTILLLFLLYLVFRLIKGKLLKTVLSIIGVFLIIGVALSRLFLEAHYLSDTIGAVSISIAWFCFVYLIMKKYDHQEKISPSYYRSR
ncbi:phosphatase PAP2 family protein [Oceanobacillus caeni]